MANINHELIADPYIHEPKGVASATINKTYVSTGTGTGVWKKIPVQGLSNITSNGVVGQFLVVDGTGNFLLASSANGSIYFYNIATPYTLTYPSVFTKVAPTTVASGGTPILITAGTNARLTYTGVDDTKLDVVFSASIDQSSGADRDIEFAIYKNGAIVNGSNVIVTTQSGKKVVMSCHSELNVSQNDYVEVYGINRGNNGDVKVYTFVIAATTAGA
jgi:hypothetical protein